VSRDPAEREKQALAEALLGARDLCLSAQVLQEFYVQATRSSRPDPLTERHAADLCRAFSRFPVQPITLELVHASIAAKQRFGIAYWDAAIVEAARLLGCEEVLSEDLSHGQAYDGVVVRNPFL
jgi:predicted nucleic acid-binding protein